MRHFLPNSGQFLLESRATAAVKWINGHSQGGYSTQSDTGSMLHLKWVPSSCFQEINTLTLQWQTKTWTKQHPCSLMMISTLKRMLVVEANEVGIRGKVKCGTCVILNAMIYYTAVFGNGLYSQCQWLC